MDLLKDNQDKIYWKFFWRNPNIFELDKKAMKKQMQPLAEEIIAKALHPSRLNKILKKYNYNIITEEYESI